MPSDEELMIAVRAGDQAAFEQLVRRYQAVAWGAAYGFLGDAAEAEDMAQEAFLKILDAASRYRPVAAFRTYLYRVVTRVCLDHAQKKRPVYTRAIPDVPDGRPSPPDVLVGRERKHSVRAALEGLSPNQRMAVVLRYYEGLGYAEIAAALETSTKGVERLLARARSRLETLLEHLLE